MTDKRLQGLHAASDAALADAGGRLSTPRDVAEDDEITREADAGAAESEALGDTGTRLAEWRDAERAIDDTDPGTAEGEELREDASKAHDAYSSAEQLQRRRHGIGDGDDPEGG